MENIREYLTDLCAKAKAAQAKLALASDEMRNNALEAIAEAIVERADCIIEANRRDIDEAEKNGISRAMCDRLMLNEERIEKLAASVRKLKAIDDPLNKSESWTRPNGLVIERVSVPLGNVGVIYEARPNVTVDVAAICIKSGNAAILRGGKEAYNTNLALEDVLRAALEDAGLDKELVSLVHDTSREGSNTLMRLNGYIDVLIPRGGKGLISAVVENASVPVIETGAGNCHIYVDKDADFDKALNILVNAKVSRPSVCNAAEKLIVHASVAEKFLPLAAQALGKHNVELRGDEHACKIISTTPAGEDDLTREYNDYIMSIYVVDGIKEAIEHINAYSTGHSEAIITEDASAAEEFLNKINSAAVYHNASTRFTDGEEFGFGAEIGISTQKLHARGPFALEALTSIKYKIHGNGHIR
ncbi:MAG: glutamate-5-semialdehyde dehydrogenase [Ruminococcaceae bacterium]|nr:glutamate-5-semialdehyde dehydrogenase [Oscillospiraceae bacterium]